MASSKANVAFAVVDTLDDVNSPRKNAKPSAPKKSNKRVVDQDGVPLARVRRTANPVAFIVTGVVIGIIAGFILSARTENGSFDPASSSMYVAALFGTIGALLGGLVYIVADKIAER